MKTLLLLACALLAPLSTVQNTPATAKPVAEDAKAVAAKVLAQKGAYPLAKCVVSGDALDAKAVDVLIDERLVRVCCNNCVEPAKKDKAAIFAKIDAAVIEQQRAAYPLTTCLVSGDELGKDAVSYVHGTYLMRLCCQDCVAVVKRNAEAPLKKLQDAYIAKQKADYPMDTCIVNEGEGLESMGGAVDYLWGTRLYRLCCGGCKKAVQMRSDELWAQLEAARKLKQAKK